MPRIEYEPILALRRASRCPASCVISYRLHEALPASDPKASVFVVTHNDQTAPFSIGTLDEATDNAWEAVLHWWPSVARDLHREAAMQSDWPVF